MAKISILRKGVFARSLAAWGMFLLFPGFYFYHLGVASGLFHEVLGGFFSPVALLFLGLFIFVGGRTFSLSVKSPFFVSVIAFMLIWIIGLSTISSFLSNKEYTWAAYYQVMKLLLLWVVLFHVGLHLHLGSRRLAYVFWLSLAVIFSMMVFYVYSTGSIFFNPRTLFDADQDVTTYQGFSRSVFILAFVCYAIAKDSGVKRLVLVVASLFVLFVLGARSEFAAYFLVIGAFILMRFLKDRSQLVIPFVAIAVISVGFAFFSNEILSSRQMQILDLEDSQSWQERQELGALALDRIYENPLIGKVGGHFEAGGEGSYAHNILSAWDGFGIIGFMLYASLIVWPAIYAAKLGFLKASLSDDEKLFIFVAISSLVLAVGAKSIYSPLPALCWGLYVNVRYSNWRYRLESLSHFQQQVR